MLQPACAALLGLLLAACPTRLADDAAPGTELSPAGTGQPDSLSYDGVNLKLEDGQGQLHRLRVGYAPTPYALQASSPRVVTALLPGLEPCTVVGTAAGLKPYRNYLPQATRSGLAILSSLPSALTGISSRTVILDRQGQEVWANPQSQSSAYLEPATGAEATTDVYTVTWAGGDAIFPFGASPVLHLLSLETDGQWASNDLALAPPAAVADVELLAANPQGALLLLQYDYEVFEFLTVRRDPLAITGRWRLDGQPVTSLTYPGPAYSYVGLRLESDAARLQVVNKVAGGEQVWTFGLSGGTMSAGNADPPARLVEDAPRQTADNRGGLFPQSILPPRTKVPWSCPAVYGTPGTVLVVNEDGSAEWVKYD